MTEAGNTIIFRKRKSIITTDRDCKIANPAINAAKPENTTELEKKNGVYTFDMWLEAAGSNCQAPGNYYEDHNRGCDNYQNIGEISRDFTWLEDAVM